MISSSIKTMRRLTNRQISRRRATHSYGSVGSSFFSFSRGYIQDTVCVRPLPGVLDEPENRRVQRHDDFTTSSSQLERTLRRVQWFRPKNTTHALVQLRNCARALNVIRRNNCDVRRPLWRFAPPSWKYAVSHGDGRRTAEFPGRKQRGAGRQLAATGGRTKRARARPHAAVALSLGLRFSRIIITVVSQRVFVPRRRPNAIEFGRRIASRRRK